MNNVIFQSPTAHSNSARLWRASEPRSALRVAFIQLSRTQAQTPERSRFKLFTPCLHVRVNPVERSTIGLVSCKSRVLVQFEGKKLTELLYNVTRQLVEEVCISPEVKLQKQASAVTILRNSGCNQAVPAWTLGKQRLLLYPRVKTKNFHSVICVFVALWTKTPCEKGKTTEF